MTASWVAPAITGAVGIAGIAATFWTARQARADARRSLDREDRNRLRGERREAYVEFLSAAESVALWEELMGDPMAIFPVRGLLILEMSDRGTDRHGRFHAALTQLNLVASREVQDAATTFRGNFRRALKVRRKADGNDAREQLRKSLDDLRTLVKRELGYLPGA